MNLELRSWGEGVRAWRPISRSRVIVGKE
jgi:hypothetical protein